MAASLVVWGGMAGTSAWAANFSWDPSTSSGVNYGDGVWSTSVSNWTTDGGTTNVAWTGGANTAVFPSSGLSGTVPSLVTITLGESISLEGINMGGSYGANVLITDGGSAFKLLYGGSGLLSNNSSTKTLQVDAVIDGTINLVKSNLGTVILSKNNTYTGTMTISGNSGGGGTLQIGANGTTGSLGTGDVIFSLGSGQTAVSNLSFIRSDAVSVSNNIQINASTGAGIQNFGNTVTLTGTISGSGAGGLTKGGSGVLILTGTNTYTGTTTVSNGTLIINGDQSGATGTATVSSGNILGGTGTLGGAVVVNGKLAPGDVNGIGTLSTKALSFSSTGSFEVGLGRNAGTPGSDAVAVTGAVSVASGANLQLSLQSGYTAASNGDIFYLINNDGSDAISGVFTQLNGVATDLSEGSIFSWNSQQWQITYLASFGSSFTGGNDLAIQAVPEPATWACLLAGGLGMWGCAWLRRRQGGKVG